MQALETPGVNPIYVGTLVKNEEGKFKLIKDTGSRKEKKEKKEKGVEKVGEGEQSGKTKKVKKGNHNNSKKKLNK